jgi:hypothetical protein
VAVDYDQTRTRSEASAILGRGILSCTSLTVFVTTFTFLNLFAGYWQQSLAKERRANLLARDATTTGLIRFDRSTGEDLGRYLPALAAMQGRRRIILAGMSQMYAINDSRPGDQSISEWLDDSLAPRGTRVFGLAAPNLSNEELLLLLLAVAEDDRTRPQVFVFGACFDKFRNIGLRPGYRRYLAARPLLLDRWKALAEHLRRQFPAAAAKMASTLQDLVSRDAPKGASLDDRVRAGISGVLPVVAYREDLNAWGSMQLFLLRNWAFRIKPTSKRPQIPSRYQMNQEFFEAFVATARESNILPVVYVIPLNPRAENPYIPAEYAAFKTWIRETCLKSGVPFDNLEDSVPPEDWGEFMGGPDFKHFRGSGHRITATEIEKRFASVLASSQHGEAQ